MSGLMGHPQSVPQPGEWHPWYQDKEWLRDWLEGTGQFAGRHVIQVPVVPSLRQALNFMAPSVAMNTLTLTKGKCLAPAPYVGRPFVYIWPVAWDQYKRCIAGEAKIQYRPAEVWEVGLWLEQGWPLAPTDQ